MVLIPLALAYVDAMNSFHQAVDGLVRDINTVNDAWDAQAESSRNYSETEAALISVVEQTRDLADRVRYQRVPIEIRGMHGEPGGPLRLASELADLAERVLAGLQVPAPNDGTERRKALQAFNQVADEFKTKTDRVLTYIDEAARTTELLTVSGQTTTTKALPQAELVEEAVAYLEGLRRLQDTLDEILSDANAVNEAWDNSAVTGATYSETEEALLDIAERATAFYEQVQDHPIPRPVRGLGEGPKNEARPIAEHANRILAGLSIPAPDPGFERLAALDDLNHAAQRFHASINHVIYEVHAKAHTSGLGAQT